MEVEKRSQDYVSAVLKCAQDFGSLVVSVIAFGSYVKGDLSESSDVDLLVIVSDSSAPNKIMELDTKLTEIQKHFGFVEPPRSFSAKFLNFISRQTGMFVSHFICKESDFINLDFAQIFRTNKLLTSLLAPKGLVLSGLLYHANTLYGKDLLKKVSPVRVNFTDLLKSMLMNMLLAFGALVLSLYKPKEAIRFSMESIKWGMYSTYYYALRRSDKLSQIADQFIDYEIAWSHINRMMQLRDQIKVDKKFIFLSPLYSVLIHASHEKLGMQSEEMRSWMEILLDKVPGRRPFNCIIFVLATYVLGVAIIGIVTNVHVWENIIWYGWIALFCFGMYGILYFSNSYRKGIREAVQKIKIDDKRRKLFISILNYFAFSKGGSLAMIMISIPSVCAVIFLTPTGFYHPLISFYTDLYGAIWIGLFLSIAMWLAISFMMSSAKFSEYAFAVSIDIFDPDRCGGLKPIGSLSLTGVRMWSIGATAAAILFIIKISPFVIFAIFAAMVSVGVFLLVPQYKIHLVMKRSKKMKFLGVLRELHESDKKLSLNGADGDAIQKHIKANLHFNRVEKMLEWPFNTNILIGFIMSFVIPVLVLLIGLFIKVPKVALHF